MMNKDSYNSLYNKSFSLFYLNQLTKWIDLVFIANDLPVEFSNISGFATKEFLRNSTSLIKNDYNRELLKRCSCMINEIIFAMQVVSFYLYSKEPDKVISKFGNYCDELGHSFFDNLLNADSIKKVGVRHVIELVKPISPYELNKAYFTTTV